MRTKHEHHAIFSGTEEEMQMILDKKEELDLQWKEIIKKGLGIKEE